VLNNLHDNNQNLLLISNVILSTDYYRMHNIPHTHIIYKILYIYIYIYIYIYNIIRTHIYLYIFIDDAPTNSHADQCAMVIAA